MSARDACRVGHTSALKINEFTMEAPVDNHGIQFFSCNGGGDNRGHEDVMHVGHVVHKAQHE